MDVPFQLVKALPSPGDSLQVIEKERQNTKKREPKELSLQVCEDRLAIEEEQEGDDEEEVKEASKGKHMDVHVKLLPLPNDKYLYKSQESCVFFWSHSYLGSFLCFVFPLASPAWRLLVSSCPWRAHEASYYGTHIENHADMAC